MIATQGGLVIFAGFLEGGGHDIPTAWSIPFFLAAAFFLALFLYHFFILPHSDGDRPAKRSPSISLAREFLHIFALFFRKREIVPILAFFLFYRLPQTPPSEDHTPLSPRPTIERGTGTHHVRGGSDLRNGGSHFTCPGRTSRRVC